MRSATGTRSKQTLRRPLLLMGIALALVVAIVAFWRSSNRPGSAMPVTSASTTQAKPDPPLVGGSITNIYAHNLRLHQGPTFQVYVQWLRGQLVPASKGSVPSLDDPASFSLDVTNGVIHANLGDICNYLNARSSDAPLRDINITGSGDQVKITGKMHKLISFPVQLSGVIKAAGDHTIQMHITKIDVLKVPFKSVLGGLHLTLASFMGSEAIHGVSVNGNDIYFDSEQLLPAPHIRGKLTKVSLSSPDLEAVYGDVSQDLERTEDWRNFLRLRDGTLNFGKLTMNKVDLMMIDISQDAWFDLDLANYQSQLVNGYTRMTPEAGLQIFMPDVADIRQKKAEQISIEWFKNRNQAPPAAVLPQKR